MPFLNALLDVILELAPWLVLGLVSAGLVRAWLPQRLVLRWLGGQSKWAPVRAAVVGTPLPLCSCSVLPVAVDLRRQGAGRGATSSFLVSTPANGVDSIAVTYGLLGPFLAWVRPAVGILTATLVGWSVEVFGEKRKPATALPIAGTSDAPSMNEDSGSGDSGGGDCCGSKQVEPAPASASSCCSSKAEPEPAAVSSCCVSQAEAPAAGSCCSAEQNKTVAPDGWVRRGLSGVRYAFTNLLPDIAGWIAIGVIAAAAVAALAPEGWLAEVGRGPIGMLAAVLVGVPMYLCATASVPLAAAMLAAGASPGVVVVFLLAGPATNLATFALLRKELGTRSAWVFLVSMTVVSVAAGMAVDALAAALSINVAGQVSMGHDHGGNWLGYAAAALLIGAMVWHFSKRLNARSKALQRQASRPPRPTKWREKRAECSRRR
ncbi:MAG: SO_0444 family Cu/Zn efflux transporter [Planctomycetota bacterium]